MAAPPAVVGIDVANAPRATARRPTGARWAITNAETGMAALVVRLQALPPTLMGLEATGGYHRAGVAALAAAAWPAWGSIPARDVATARGPWANTAARETHVVAPFAAAVRPGPRPLPDVQTEERCALLARRRP
jgi:transposase